MIKGIEIGHYLVSPHKKLEKSLIKKKTTNILEIVFLKSGRRQFLGSLRSLLLYG